MKFTLCRDKVVVYLEALKRFITFPKNHSDFESVYRYIMDSDATEQGFLELFVEVADQFISKYTDGEITQDESGINRLEGLEIPENILSKINELRRAGYSWRQHQKFWARCLLNPRRESIVDLFRFIEHHNLVITDDGHFLGYKAITYDWKDKWSRRIDNSIGTTVTMDRDKVTFDPSVACSTGLHVACYHYAKGYQSGDDRLVIVEVDPKDVVSVPTDCNSEKIRVCRYKVISEVDPLMEEMKTSVVNVTDEGDVKEVKTTVEIKAGKTWTVVEKTALKTVCLKSIKENDGKIYWSNLAKLFPGRSSSALRKQWNKIKKEDLSNKSSKKATVKKALDRRGQRWTADEVNMLFSEYGGKVLRGYVKHRDFCEHYAKRFGRTPKAVARKLESIRSKQEAQFNGLL